MRFMVHILSILILVTSLYLSPAWANDNVIEISRDLVLPADMDKSGYPNIGQYVLDAPAGKHGHITVKDGNFYFADGQRAKFWGTNLAFSANFPYTKKQAEQLAKRLAFFGFNAVRLHHMDFFFEPNGIFEDTAPAYKDAQAKETGHLSRKQLDRLDYLIYQLKQQGIYINFNLLVSRRFTEADGLQNAEQFGIAAKPVSLFDPHLIDLQKQYAKKLLTHKNKYTGLTYAQDPAVIMVELTNENSLIEYWHSNRLNGSLYSFDRITVSDYYIKQLDEMWSDWLIKKYGDNQSAYSAWKISTTESSEKKSMTIDLPPLDQWHLEQHGGAKASVKIANSIAGITKTKITGTHWHIQFAASPLSLKKGENYELTFTASSDTVKTLTVGAQQARSPWTQLGLNWNIHLTPDPETYRVTFEASQNTDAAKLAFMMGVDQGTAFLSDISLRQITQKDFLETIPDITKHRPVHKQLSSYPPQAQQDIKEFYLYLTKSYADTLYNYLKNDLSVKASVTAFGGMVSSEYEIPAQNNMDYIDVHSYWDHPTWRSKTLHMKSIFTDENLGIIGGLKKTNALIKQSLSEPKPFVVSEWNHVYPNPYAYETPLLLAVTALQEDWDALFQFAYSHNIDNNPERGITDSNFDIYANAQQLYLNVLGSYLYLKGDSSTVSIDLADKHYRLSSPYIQGIVGDQSQFDCQENCGGVKIDITLPELKQSLLIK